MKSLSNYTQEKQTALYSSTGAFFAFGNEQFTRQMQPNTKYVALGAGLYCPKDNAKQLIEGLNKIHNDGVQADLSDHTKEQIILRELRNYECFYTNEIDDAVEALIDYPFTVADIEKVYHDNYSAHA